MADLVDGISREAASEQFEALLSSRHFRRAKRCTSILKLLFNRWNTREGEAAQKDLAFALHWDVEYISPTVADLRRKLWAYNKESDAELSFELRDGHSLLVRHKTPTFTTYNTVPIIFRRDDPGDQFEQTICEPSSDVLLVALTGHRAFTEHVNEWFRHRLIHTQHFRVLVWRPATPAMIEMFATHLGVHQTDLAESASGAWDSWKKLETSYAPPLEVYGYSLIPTALAVCNDHRMKVEFLPFNLPGGKRDSNNRPAIVLSVDDHQRAYNYFQQWFDDLWYFAMAETPEPEVHPHWREKRKARLRDRGLIP